MSTNKSSAVEIRSFPRPLLLRIGVVLEGDVVVFVAIVVLPGGAIWSGFGFAVVVAASWP